MKPTRGSVWKSRQGMIRIWTEVEMEKHKSPGKHSIVITKTTKGQLVAKVMWVQRNSRNKSGRLWNHSRQTMPGSLWLNLPDSLNAEANKKILLSQLLSWDSSRGEVSICDCPSSLLLLSSSVMSWSIPEGHTDHTSHVSMKQVCTYGSVEEIKKQNPKRLKEKKRLWC